MHHRSGKKGIHHEASDPEKEKKEGFHGGGVYCFLPCYRELFKNVLRRSQNRSPSARYASTLLL